jgi:hypothetical protein
MTVEKPNAKGRRAWRYCAVGAVALTLPYCLSEAPLDAWEAWADIVPLWVVKLVYPLLVPIVGGYMGWMVYTWRAKRDTDSYPSFGDRRAWRYCAVGAAVLATTLYYLPQPSPLQEWRPGLSCS